MARTMVSPIDFRCSGGLALVPSPEPGGSGLIAKRSLPQLGQYLSPSVLAAPQAGQLLSKGLASVTPSGMRLWNNYDAPSAMHAEVHGDSFAMLMPSP
mgnify:CR=1 FL=1